MKRRIPLAPEEGWLTFGLVLLICLSLAWSIDDVRWVLGKDAYLDYLVLAAIGGVLVGFIGPKVGWGRWLTYLIGCIFAALLVPLLTALVDFPDGAPLGVLYQATAWASVQAYIDIAIRGSPTTLQYLHWVMSIGLVVWATSMFASYAVFGHHRSLNAVVVVGILLVGNMAFTAEDQLPLLVVFSLASLFLLIRSHVFDEQTEWLRRRIGDPTSIRAVYLRGGTAFIASTVALAFVLTQVAASAPLEGAWGGVNDSLISLSRTVSKYFPTGGTTRSVGLAFGSSTLVTGIWNNNSDEALIIQRDPLDDADYYWRAVTYDKIGLKDWDRSDTQTIVRQAGDSLMDTLADDATQAGLHTFTFTINPVGFHQSTMLAPATAVEADEPSRISYLGASGFFATMDREGGSGPYEVASRVLVRGNGPGELNKAALRAAGTDYPPEVLEYFTDVVPGSLGPDALALRDRIVAEAESQAPVDLADRLFTVLRSSEYTYDTDIRDRPCQDLSMVECFARFKEGYCQYYAATMAVILRDLGVPTRLAEGFLPGTREAGIERILNSNAHAWVEVYFPGYGWVLFDPTGGALPGQVGPLPSGPPTGSAPPPRPSASAALPSFPTGDGRTDDLGPTGGGSGITAGSIGPLIAVTVLLLIVVGGLAFAVWQRGPRGATSADAAYGTVTRIASRFGFGPRPAQTVYEYAGSLGEVLPAVRPELETVARAKVESVYAREVLGSDRLDALRAAQRRLRLSLLRLAFRRRERRRRR